jgi:hypothetical protein
MVSWCVCQGTGHPGGVQIAVEGVQVAVIAMINEAAVIQSPGIMARVIPSGQNIHTQGYAGLVSGLSRLPQGTRHKAWAKRQRVDHAAVEGRTAVRPDGAGGVVRRRTENCMTLIHTALRW